MSLPERFSYHLKEQHFFEPADGLIVACSGGIDSVVLCHLLHRAGFTFEIAHMNFQLRGEESARDEQFVKTLAEQFGCAFHVALRDAAAFASAHGVSVQMAARELRYQWFQTLLQPTGSRRQWILTAHQADDNAETLLLNLFRGTGIRGLAGIPQRNGQILRPLLPFSRKEIEAFASENAIRWVEDHSNIEDKYTRNFIRLNLIPELEKRFPAVRSNLQNDIQRFKEATHLYDLALSKILRKLVKKEGNHWKIPVHALLLQPSLQTVVYECFRPFEFQSHQVSDLLHLCQAETGKWIESPGYRVIKNRNWLLITDKKQPATLEPVMILEEGINEMVIPGGRLRLTYPESDAIHIHKDPAYALLDRSELQFPLILRKWKAGDYFYPFGMKKKKKVARFLIDQKISMADKENVYVVETNKKIIWVVGMRIDDRFQVKKNTTGAVQIQWLKD